MVDRYCELVDGCCERHYARGMCSLHYQRWRAGKRGKDLIKPRPRKWPVPEVCCINGCEESDITGRMMCHFHYHRWRSGDRGKRLARPREGSGSIPGYFDRARLAPQRSPSTQDLYWAAGFLEGEGSFVYASQTQRVTAGQKQKAPLIKLKEVFGGSIYTSQRRSGPFHGWTLTGPRARGLMMTLYTLMSPRRKSQIKRALDG